ncbi:outer membrane beta-barrel protein [Bdellovibrio sp. HCB288]|uniref:outer membrane beta-barrel protein n=1 Tax=Bdellovibrio sp. HCB288 TaxID=3394355 RepID=UPI0039B60286
MKKYFMALFAMLLFHSQAQAALDYGLELGVRQQNGDAYGPVSTESRTGFQGGAFVHLPLEGNVAHFRTGLLYTQRPLQTRSDSTGTEIDWNLDYLDIPIAVLFKPHEKFGVYFGFIASINISSSCSGSPDCRVDSIDTPAFPMVFGATFKFNPTWGLHFYLDANNSNVARGLADYKSVGLNAMISLD